MLNCMYRGSNVRKIVHAYSVLRNRGMLRGEGREVITDLCN